MTHLPDGPRKAMGSQRGEFQHSIIKLNLLANGALIAFALEPSMKYKHALLVCPLISFTLFSLWIHHAIVIITEIDAGYIPAPSRFCETMKRLTFSASILANFALIPAGAVLFYRSEVAAGYTALQIVDLVLMGLVFALYFCWFYLFYIKECRVR